MGVYFGEARSASKQDADWMSARIEIDSDLFYLTVNSRLAGVPPISRVTLERTSDPSTVRIKMGMSSWLFRSEALGGLEEEVGAAQGRLQQASDLNGQESATWPGYVLFAIVVIIGTIFAMEPLGVEDSAVPYVMSGAWAIVLLLALTRRSRDMCGRIGTRVFAVVLVGGWFAIQAYFLGWLTISIISGTLQVGFLWLAALGGGYYLFFKQLWWVFTEGYYTIRAKLKRTALVNTRGR